MNQFDVIVVGGGHAGCEAAHASAMMGCSTALISLALDRLGAMSCNPAIGGLAKGQLVKEIDALGGVMGQLTDQCAIQYRRLNLSKGPAVQSSRAQCDKYLYTRRMYEFLSQIPRLCLIHAEVMQLLVRQQHGIEVQLADGTKLSARAVIVTTGTFLRGKLFTGLDQSSGGRIGEHATSGLSTSLENLGFRLRRLKTGTPPRLHRKSIAWEKLEAQHADTQPVPFSFYHCPEPFPLLPQVECFITYTNPQTHEIIADNLDRSPLYTGMIQGIGPRYCPSIEDKIHRFRDRERHQVFLEPEGLTTDEIYVNGVSTSLPRDVQERLIHSILGLEKARLVQYGYAVEYDCIDARQLKATYESKEIPGLFCAGQINGTSGYEEAAAQGLVAGINAARLVHAQPPYLFSRSDGYLGVLADDLVLKGIDEPYRMFTSRAEHRLLLREDNADLRLSEIGYHLGLLPQENYEQFLKKREQVDYWRDQLKNFYFVPHEKINGWLEGKQQAILKDRVSADAFLKRPEVDWQVLCTFGFPGQSVLGVIREQVEIQTKYAGYIQRDLDLLEGLKKNELIGIPYEIDFNLVPGLSNEIKSRLSLVRPETLGQASRMSGVTPAAIANLWIYIKMNQARFQQRVVP